jgi:hypothetical protein
MADAKITSLQKAEQDLENPKFGESLLNWRQEIKQNTTLASLSEHDSNKAGKTSINRTC